MDYDDDGMLDIIVGDRNGFTHYYRRTSESPITLTKEDDLVCGGVQTSRSVLPDQGDGDLCPTEATSKAEDGAKGKVSGSGGGIHVWEVTRAAT